MPLNWTPLGPKQAVAFWDPSNPSNIFSPQINPQTIARTPGSVRKYVKTTNGTSVISGDREYPPVEIKLVWDQLDITDYQAISAFTAISPIVFSDNNNQGFYGVLVIDKAGQINGKTSNVWALEASFLVLGPFNGSTGSINSLTAPSLAVSNTTTGGYISGGTTIYLWLTVFTAWGESLVGPQLTYSVPAGTNTNKGAITWTQPVSPYFTKARLYWANIASSATATLLSEIQSGQTGSFTLYSNYNVYANGVVPPTFSTAFTGYWNGASWTQQ